MELLGIEVGDDLVGRWKDWIAPIRQPFFVDDPHEWPELSDRVLDRNSLGDELRDTYRLWQVDRELAVLGVDEQQFMALPRSRRGELVRAQVRHRRGAVPTVRNWAEAIGEITLREQADGHRFVWWPSMLRDENGAAVVRRIVSTDRATSRHTEVDAATWRRCERRLPGARGLAGTFPDGSGANCFGTVMAAAGVAGAASTWIQCDPFLDWLNEAGEPRGHDDAPGTVLLWREGDVPNHAAVTLGDGWALEKPSQEWHSPRTVMRVADLIRSHRRSGQRLERWSLRPDGNRWSPAGVE